MNLAGDAWWQRGHVIPRRALSRHYESTEQITEGYGKTMDGGELNINRCVLEYYHIIVSESV